MLHHLHKYNLLIASIFIFTHPVILLRASLCHNSWHHPAGVVTELDEWNPNIIIITSLHMPLLSKKFSSRNTTIVYTDDGLMLQHDYFLKMISQDSKRTLKWK
jgi:hypothetical protein